MEVFAFAFTEYIVDRALVFVPLLLTIGAILKATPKCPDWGIPWVLLCSGIVLCVLMLGMHVDSVIQGILIAGTAVFGNQLYKQTIERT